MQCPFLKIYENAQNCVYCDSTGNCDDIQTNTGNGDAWCVETIEQSFNKAAPKLGCHACHYWRDHEEIMFFCGTCGTTLCHSHT